MRMHDYRVCFLFPKGQVEPRMGDPGSTLSVERQVEPRMGDPGSTEKYMCLFTNTYILREPTGYLVCHVDWDILPMSHLGF